MAPKLTALIVLFCYLPSLSGQAKPRGVRIAENVMESFVIHKVPPEYPPSARLARIEDTVHLQIWINKFGGVEEVTIVSGHPLLAPSAIEAVKQWKYKPYLLSGEPVEVETTVSIRFALTNEPAFPPDLQASPTAVPNRVRVSSAVVSGLVVRKVPPIYPENARRRHIQGTVSLKAVIDTEGRIARLELITGDPELAPAAIEAVKQWRYKPYLLNSKPVELETQIQVNFALAR
jgi:TonB family protein